ncbi:hypothetical protein [Psychrobacillus sp. NPDC093180]|uniref:hypothetical protein n=1 Tax=Psychrobacillus sp. NPDC093180 TaxID=3364489 RepID=UPI0037FB4831
MVPFEKKKRICKENRTLLQLVYLFGSGVMFKRHIQRYFSAYEGVHEIETSKRLLKLKENEIIEYHNIFGSKVIKLKKFAVYFLLDKGREDVSSINFTAAKAKKSAYLNQIILNNASIKAKWPTLDDLFGDLPEITTYFMKQKETYKFLEEQYKNHYTSRYAYDEIRKLIATKEMATKFVTNDRTVKKTTFNMNSLQAANIFFGIKISGTVRPIQQIDLLDLNGLMTPAKFVAKINSTVDYLDVLFDSEELDFHYNLYVQSSQRKVVLLRSKDKIDELIRDHCKREISWGIINLNLESTLFRGQKVLLNV